MTNLKSSAAFFMPSIEDKSITVKERINSEMSNLYNDRQALLDRCECRHFEQLEKHYPEYAEEFNGYNTMLAKLRDFQGRLESIEHSAMQYILNTLG